MQVFYKARLSRLQVTSTETAMTDVLREVGLLFILIVPWRLMNFVYRIIFLFYCFDSFCCKGLFFFL